MCRGVKPEVLRAHRWPIELEQAASLEDTIDDRGSEIVVV
jgi:hypothetical protein